VERYVFRPLWGFSPSRISVVMDPTDDQGSLGARRNPERSAGYDLSRAGQIHPPLISVKTVSVRKRSFPYLIGFQPCDREFIDSFENRQSNRIVPL